MIIIVLSIWTISFFLLKDNCDRGTFGDMFGAVNAIFSGLAFAGLIFTILLQKEELELQRIELTETRQEFITQNNTLKKQRFENTFFNMIELHHKIVEGIDSSERRFVGGNNYQIVAIKGRDVFEKEYYNFISKLKHNEETGTFKDRNEIYLENYKSVQTDFGHYFRNVYRIIKLVDTTDFYSNEIVDEKKVDEQLFLEKYKYTSILRSQLSDYETLWLFYNCLTKNGLENFKPLIERYCIFKNIPKDKFFKPEDGNEYKKTAFEKTIPSA